MLQIKINLDFNNVWIIQYYKKDNEKCQKK